MSVKEIVRLGAGKYSVLLTPNLIETVFGLKEKTVLLKRSGDTYMFGGGSVYIRKDGSELPNNHYIGVAIDKFRKTW